MFQKNKYSHQIVAICKNENENKEGRYTFIADPDDIIDEIATQMFFNEFGIYPTIITIESCVKL